MVNKLLKEKNKDFWLKEINELEVLLTEKIGEYIFWNEETDYTNEKIAELITLECGMLMDVDAKERENISCFMALFMKYANAYVNDEAHLLAGIEQNIVRSQYKGCHHFFKEAIFDEKISKEEKEYVIETLNNKEFIVAGKLLKDLMENTNQLFIQEVWYDKISNSINKYKNENHCKISK